jgi:hypothetical protein
VKILLSLLLLLFARQAVADLYRWMDPDTGSIKLSSYPPPWFGNPALEAKSPRVEVIPVTRTATPVSPLATQAPVEGTGLLDKLQQFRKSALEGLNVLPAREDFARGGEGIQEQLDAFRAVSAELDKMDPGGAAARRAEEQPLMERLKQGLKAQFSPTSPVVPKR